MAIRLGALEARHRGPLFELLVATAAFSDAEVDVALELFDADDDYEFVAAFDATESLIGYACFGPTPSSSGTYDLYWLAVHPDAQNRGVGRTLVQHVEAELKERGAHLLVVETSSRPDYAATRAFYTRRGYSEVARTRDFYGPADDRIILTTRLTTTERGVVTQ